MSWGNQGKEESGRKGAVTRKAEARLLAEEETRASVKKSSTKAGKKEKPAGPGAIAAGGDISDGQQKGGEEEVEVLSFTATGIDNALRLFDVVTAKTDKASVGRQAAGIENHPEVGNQIYRNNNKLIINLFNQRRFKVIQLDIIVGCC